MHEAGLEPPRLAAPEPESGWRAFSRSEVSRTGRVSSQFATIRGISVRAVDDSETFPTAERSYGRPEIAPNPQATRLL